MGRRILNRKDKRADYEAAERRKKETDEVVEGEEEETEEEEEEEEEEGSEEEAGGDEEDAEEDEEKPKKRKPAKPAKVSKAKPRSRAAKVTRMKVVWGVFNNSNQRVATFDYPKRKEAFDLATKLQTDKKSTHFVQPVKEPLEEKKEKE